MTERVREKKKTISKAEETGKEAEVNEHKKIIFKKRISCFGCDAFEDMRPIEKLATFRSEFALLHDNRKKNYDEYMMAVEMMARLTSVEESIKDRLIGENREESFWDDFQFFRKCGNCKSRIVRDNFSDDLFKRLTAIIRNNFGELSERKKKDIFNYLASIIGKRRGEKLYNAGEKLFDIGAWPLKRLSSAGIDQRPYLNEDYANLLSEEEAMLLFLYDYKIGREDTGYHYLDLFVNLDLPFNKLVASFKKLVKEKQAALYEVSQKADGRDKTPPYELWQNYMLAYILKEKDVKANLLNPEWPSEPQTRKDVANKLFPGEETMEYKLQKLNRYIREAKKLINQANAYEGPFKILKGKSQRKLLPFAEAFPFLAAIEVNQNETNPKKSEKMNLKTKEAKTNPNEK